MAASAGASFIPRKDGFYDKYIRNCQILNQVQLKRLKEHKYSAEGISLLEPPMQVFWRWAVEQIPTTWAPNALTIVGLIVNVLSTLILVFYSPDAIQDVPSWAYILCALGLFMYQTLDAIDGKQARRTKSNNPLGELFDHGCDSISTVMVMLGASIALRLGEQPALLLFENLATLFLFYCVHWQTYVCGTLRFGKLNVTEGQFTVMGIYLFAAIVGADTWSITMPVVNMPLRMMPMVFSFVGALIQLKDAFQIIFMEGGVGKNGSTVAGTSTVFPVLHITAVLVLAVMIQQKSPSMVFENHPCLYILAFGLLGAKIINKLVVAHMTKSEMDLWDMGFIGPGLLFLNQYFDCVFSEYLLLWICLLWVLFDVVRYSAILCQEISEYLEIYVFVITSRPPSGSCKNGSID